MKSLKHKTKDSKPNRSDRKGNNSKVITIKFEAIATVYNYKVKAHVEIEALLQYDGYQYRKSDDDVFSQWLIDDHQAIVKNLPIKGGVIQLSYDSSLERLKAFVEYNADRILSPDETEALRLYTQGQLKDGIGENMWNDWVDEYKSAINFSDVSACD